MFLTLTIIMKQQEPIAGNSAAIIKLLQPVVVPSLQVVLLFQKARETESVSPCTALECRSLR